MNAVGSTVGSLPRASRTPATTRVRPSSSTSSAAYDGRPGLAEPTLDAAIAAASPPLSPKFVKRSRDMSGSSTTYAAIITVVLPAPFAPSSAVTCRSSR